MKTLTNSLAPLFTASTLVENNVIGPPNLTENAIICTERKCYKSLTNTDRITIHKTHQCHILLVDLLEVFCID